ncbi:CD225/dispanin family protein [Arenimonas fontis]|uniref:CD225/dispanin family protein n=1 Tax=Arenimonas fontis TaxID=2608255 RepID=UPI001FE8CA73|nr:CD225/dispanin family protein [Arenimonas fontis]
MPNHLVWAILATICCCLPTGIVSIVYAAQVDGKLQAGDLAGARQSSDNAKLWAWISFGLGLVGISAYFGLAFLGFLADAGRH